jgi:hypothetical protein
MISLNKINRRGQEEMVGFVLIVILVAIVFLVFIGIFIRQDSRTIDKDSREVVQFLESFERYTSICATGFEPDFSDIGGLIEDCYEGKLCVSGENACSVLKRESKEILESSFSVGEQNYYKGYELGSYYESSSDGSEENREEVLILMEGNCNGSFVGGETLRSGFDGVFVSELKLCF